MPLTRQQLSQIYRPAAQKLIQSTTWSSAGKFNLANGIDLSIPLRGLRIVFKGRVTIATAAYTNVNPESILNLINRIYITGLNSRQNGSVTYYDMSLADAVMMAQLFGYEHTMILVKQASGSLTDYGSPTTPFANIIPVTAQTNDFVVAVDLPFHPHSAPMGFRAAFAARQEELKATLQIQLTFATNVDNAENAIGLSAATSATTISAYNSGSGNPSIDIYGLPILMGLDMKDAVLPGVLSRTIQPIVTTANNAAGASLLNLQQLKTTRIYVKSGTSVLNPYFKTLSDTIVTSLGLKVGGNRIVREDDDFFAVKFQAMNNYARPAIQGVALLDFVESGSPYACYPGDDIGQGTLFQLTGAVTGTTNGYANVLQEELLWLPEGSLYN